MIRRTTAAASTTSSEQPPAVWVAGLEAKTGVPEHGCIPGQGGHDCRGPADPPPEVHPQAGGGQAAAKDGGVAGEEERAEEQAAAHQPGAQAATTADEQDHAAQPEQGNGDVEGDGQPGPGEQGVQIQRWIASILIVVDFKINDPGIDNGKTLTTVFKTFETVYQGKQIFTPASSYA